MAIERFEDIEAWKKARQLTKLIYEQTQHADFAKDFGLKDQMRRSSVSVMSNTAEGFGRSGNKEFIHFLSMANGSVAELKSQLYVAYDVGYLPTKEFKTYTTQTEKIGKLISGFIRYLKKSDKLGSKFK